MLELLLSLNAGTRTSWPSRFTTRIAPNTISISTTNGPTFSENFFQP
jgi:hypothetical protein